METEFILAALKKLAIDMSEVSPTNAIALSNAIESLENLGEPYSVNGLMALDLGFCIGALVQVEFPEIARKYRAATMYPKEE